MNRSAHAGGTLALGMVADWDSPDPGNTYSVSAWNLSRYYARPLLSYANAPGKAGLGLVPDLATGLGQSSDGGRTWTYHIRSGVRYSNGQTVTAADVKYAIERSNWGREVLADGPTYFLNLIDPKAATGGQSWVGPYKDPKGSLPSSMIATPNATTIVFHLVKPFADFDYLATLPETAPVPRRSDTGAQYESHIVSSGPYEVDSFAPGKGMTLSRNPYWSPATDPGHLHPQLPEHITIRTKQGADQLDDGSMSGQVTEVGFTSVQAAAQERILTTPSLKTNADDPINGFLYYAGIDKRIEPFTNINCRKAVEVAADKRSLLNMYGGTGAGQIATTILPPTVAGYTDYPNPYATPGNQGDPAEARRLIATCKRQLGAAFTTTVNIAARSDKPAEVAAASALVSELHAVGFKAQVELFPTATYSSEEAGAPSYVHAHQLGIAFMQWGADWPDGYGFLDDIVNGAEITAAGNYNLGELNNSTVNGLLAQGIADPNPTTRNHIWGQVDRDVMEQAVILPIAYGKALLYRPPGDTNATISQAYGEYDYPAMGVTP